MIKKRTPRPKVEQQSVEELRDKYITQKQSAHSMSLHYGISFNKMKEWLLRTNLWDDELAQVYRRRGLDELKIRRKETRLADARKLLAEAGMTIAEVVDAPIEESIAEGVEQPGGNSIVPALPAAIGPTGGLDLESSAYERLSYNQRRAVDLMADTVNRTTYEAIAERLGISAETLLVYRKDPVFQQALEEEQNPLFKSDLRTLYRGSLMNKLTTGKDSKEDRLLAARIVGDAGPDSTLNTAVQVNIKGDW